MKRTIHSSFVLAAIFALLAGLAGCSGDDDSPTGPTSEQPPVLPDAARLSVDLGFFTPGADLDKAFGHQNFYNAYLRAIFLTAMTDLVLAPPVAAFALAVDTVPSHQQDGSWIWVYTFVDGDEEAEVRLRGRVDGDRVLWQMFVSFDDVEQALWFDGTTALDGDAGTWTFYDVAHGGVASGRVTWLQEGDHHELALEALAGADAGDTLTFSRTGDQARIDFADSISGETFFIRWNEADGTGSLRVPDYNGGEEACWDEDQWDVECAI
jgi:hypothetical protein